MSARLRESLIELQICLGVFGQQGTGYALQMNMPAMAETFEAFGHVGQAGTQGAEVGRKASLYPD